MGEKYKGVLCTILEISCSFTINLNKSFKKGFYISWKEIIRQAKETELNNKKSCALTVNLIIKFLKITVWYSFKDCRRDQ